MNSTPARRIWRLGVRPVQQSAGVPNVPWIKENKLVDVSKN
ncbi:MAG: hypothetical protein ACREV9_05805 [Burkholderiales bacterium]